ncbi:hypothetical protein VTJ04DRAFT_3147 [Mycothermus thermophilus]|uniref:uncharacterized protein n=1 Tax=Humicola insolens TaxID=85995 RepID=UPI003742E2EC
MARPSIGLFALIPLIMGILAVFPVPSQASQYRLVDVYNWKNFFSAFDFFTDSDPTHGFVQYVDFPTANATGLARIDNRKIYLGVDYTTPTTAGRASVRVSSKKAYTHGLFVADIQHMPAGVGPAGSCALWPAFWSFGPDWPNSGEIDIIEGVHNQLFDMVTLHTGPGCLVRDTGGARPGTVLMRQDCEGFMGCSQWTETPNTYGAQFNANGGGVFAMEWTSRHIKVWFFPRNDAVAIQLADPEHSVSAITPPSRRHRHGHRSLNNLTIDLTDTFSPAGHNQTDNNDDAYSSAPAMMNPSLWGQPLASFLASDTCDFDQHFRQHNLIFDTTFCGDWAGAT